MACGAALQASIIIDAYAMSNHAYPDATCWFFSATVIMQPAAAL